MKTTLSRLLALLLVLITAAFALTACNSNPAKDLGDIVYVEIDMENGDYIKLELYPKIAPITVANFVKLCNENFYDGIIFHRVIANFMIQGGDPLGTGMGGSKEEIKGEFSANGVKNDISHVRGVISMARLGENPYTGEKNHDTASSQFFIVHQDSTFLDGQYAAFGRVIEGMETVDAIANVATDQNDKPLADQKIATIRVISEADAKTEGKAPVTEAVVEE